MMNGQEGRTESNVKIPVTYSVYSVTPLSYHKKFLLVILSPRYPLFCNSLTIQQMNGMSMEEAGCVIAPGVFLKSLLIVMVLGYDYQQTYLAAYKRHGRVHRLSRWM